MSIFITGINSFVGKELVKVLKKKRLKFTGCDIDKDNNFFRSDIRNKKISRIIPKSSIVVHLAALSNEKVCAKNKKKAYDVNVNGTINLLKACSKKKCNQFIFASTEWVYGERKNPKINKEKDVVKLSNLSSYYAKTKLLIERYLKKNKFNFSVTILRFGIIYGPRKSNWSAVEKIMSTIKTENKIIVGSKKTARKFIHVNDIAVGIVKTFHSHKNTTYNLGGNKLVSLKELIDKSCNILKKKVEVIETNKYNVNIRNISSRKISKELKWSPKIKMEDGLKTLKKFI
jgi:UDP-glucose 4-epimerase